LAVTKRAKARWRKIMHAFGGVANGRRAPALTFKPNTGRNARGAGKPRASVILPMLKAEGARVRA